ncbi:MAG: hypothetical protein ABEH61_04360 [Haloarculaceae archaeon]
MRRRRVLGLCVTGFGAATSGCAVRRGPFGGGPDPTVVDHVRGDVRVTETTRVFELGGEEYIRAVVENTGIDAEVSLALFWVPELGLDPEGKSRARLREMGYELVTERVLALPGGEERTVRFDVSMPERVAGYYVRKNNRTFGGVIENRGEAGRVTVQLVDTTDMDDQRVLATRTVHMDAGERRTVTLRTGERYEMFRIDAFPAG